MEKRLSLLDSVTKYIVAAIILAIPLYPKFPFIRIPGTFVSIRLEDSLLLISGILVFFYILPNIRQMLKNPLVRSIMLYLSIGLLSVLSAIFVTHTVVPHIGILHWVRRVEYFVPLFLGIFAIKRNPESLQFYFKLLLIVILVSFLYAYGQKNFEWPIIITQNQEYSKGVALRWMPGSHINAMFAGHYDLATYLVMTLPIVVAAFTILKGVKTRIILAVTFVAGLWLLVNSASRISLASYMGAAFFALLLVRKYRYIPVVIIVSILFVGFSTNLIARYSRLFDVVKEKVPVINLIEPKVIYAQEEDFTIRRQLPSPTPTPIPILEDRSTSIRLNVEWPRAIRAFTKNPLLGTGFSSITLATDNDYLRLLGETGIMGFMAFMLIFVRIAEMLFSKIRSLWKKEGLELAFIGGVIGSLPGIFLNAFFIDVFEASKFAISFWLLLGMALALLNTKIFSND